MFTFLFIILASSGRDRCYRGYRSRSVLEGLTSKKHWRSLGDKNLHWERSLTPDFGRLSVSNSCTGCAVQPRDKNVLINRSKSLVENICHVFCIKKLIIGNECMLRTEISRWLLPLSQCLGFGFTCLFYQCVNVWWIFTEESPPPKKRRTRRRKSRERSVKEPGHARRIQPGMQPQRVTREDEDGQTDQPANMSTKKHTTKFREICWQIIFF